MRLRDQNPDAKELKRGARVSFLEISPKNKALGLCTVSQEVEVRWNFVARTRRIEGE